MVFRTRPMALKTLPLTLETDASQKHIARQLHRIVTNELFSGSAVLSNFLTYIVGETLAGNVGQLKEYTIGVNGLGRPPDFNPQTDAIVRIHAGRLRRLLEEYYAGPGLLDPVYIKVLKGSYVPIFRMRSSQEHANDDPAPPEPADGMPVLPTRLTLAILPFRSLSTEEAHQFLADGLGVELTRIFSTFQDISVISWHAIQKFHLQQTDVQTIGEALGAHYLVTGSIMRSERTLRISVGLVETQNSVQLWAKTYDFDLDADLLTTQDHVLDNVFAILGGHFGWIVRHKAIADRRSRTGTVEFNPALWYYHFHMNFSAESYARTRRVLEVACHNDPNNSTVLAMLSEVYLTGFLLGFDMPVHVVDDSFQLAHKAVTIDPASQHGYHALVWANVCLHHRYDAMFALEKCLELSPSSVSVHGMLGGALVCMGDYNRAGMMLNRSMLLNPHYPWWFDIALCLVHLAQGQYTDALALALKMETKDVYLVPLLRASLLGHAGMRAEAEPYVHSLRNGYSHMMPHLPQQLEAVLWDKALADAILSGLRKAGLALPV